MKKIRSIKNTCHDWLINYIPELMRKSVGGFKDKVVSIFKTKIPKQTVHGKGKRLTKPRKPFIKKAFKSEKNKKS